MLTPNVITSANRRDFCSCCAKAAGLVALGGLAACGGDNPTSPSGNTQPLTSVTATVSGRTVTVPVGAGSALSATGSMAMTQTSIGTFLLARASATSLNVLTATCTHEGTTINRTNGSQFVCPNHGSTFTTTGGVVQGPATRSLQQFTAAISGDTATFTA